MNKSREAWAKVNPSMAATTCSMAEIESLIRDAQQDIEELYRQLDALGAKAVKAKPKAVKAKPKAVKAKPKAVKAKIAAKGRFPYAVPSAEWVEHVAKQLKATRYEDGLSSPELTRAYVAEFERLNHFKPTTGASV